MKKTVFFAVAALIAAPALAEDHSAHLKGPFASPPEVTKACLECHPEAAGQIMSTSHWTWAREQEFPGKGKIAYGKKNIINNFCIALAGNYPRCTSCHIGYGWKDSSFDFTDKSRIDCLVCHDTTGAYKKNPMAAGMPDEKVDLLAAAKSVGKPSIANCGACHFYGGGADSVKHGDLDSTMGAPGKELDAHMAKEGAGLSCTSCHGGKNHDIKGVALVDSPTGGKHFECTVCHEKVSHKEAKISDHLDKVACQTCHIPEYARGQATKTYWDWSDAGKDLPEAKDANGKPVFDKKKGTFTWGKDQKPVYMWYNGTAAAYLPGDKLASGGVTVLDMPNGSKDDPKSKIYPFKPFGGKQPYDTKNNTLVTPKLFGPDGYWKHYDWNKAIELGMKDAGLPYSGEYGFTETKMYWKLNHQVAPKAKALVCNDCHGENGRMDFKALGYSSDPRK
ncbi:tetrathionate reductase family octaheme c-type cytochrome [bacterium]|nr:MAG: tetrathionate reductase family octaheme c-type cytochrome [bacterium]